MYGLNHIESRRHLRSNCYPEGADAAVLSFVKRDLLRLTVSTVGFFCIVDYQTKIKNMHQFNSLENRRRRCRWPESSGILMPDHPVELNNKWLSLTGVSLFWET